MLKSYRESTHTNTHNVSASLEPRNAKFGWRCSEKTQGLQVEKKEERGVKTNSKLDPELGGNSPKAVEFPFHWIPAGGLFFSQRMFGKN